MHYSLGYSYSRKMGLLMASVIIIILLIIIGFAKRCSSEEEVSANPTQTIAPTETIAPQQKNDEPTISVYNHNENKKIDMNLEDYIVHSVAGEMPASFSIEALMAQSICCRTYAYQRIGKGESCNGCDICTDSSHGQGFLTNSQMSDIWQEDYDKWLNIITNCVSDTKGEIITYNSMPIEVMYHASSNGMTENSGNVFVSDKPYLVSVASFDEGLVSDSVNYTLSEFISIANGSYPQANLLMNTADNQIKILDYTTSGRVNSIQLGDTVLTGREFREMLGLKSTEFSINVTSTNINITTKGYGHGVGMSQRGANEMGNNGYNCYEILSHYYSGTQIESIY